jgi:hypothetical protein
MNSKALLQAGADLARVLDSAVEVSSCGRGLTKKHLLKIDGRLAYQGSEGEVLAWAAGRLAGADPAVSEVSIREVGPKSDGLLAWASCVIYRGIYLNNIQIRRTPQHAVRGEGRCYLAYPKSTTDHFAHRPITGPAAAAIEHAVLAAWDRHEGLDMQGGPSDGMG